MQDHPVLGQVALGYSPMIDRQRAVVATRLTIFPERPDAAPDAAALLRRWPRSGRTTAGAERHAAAPAGPGGRAPRPPRAQPPLSLNVAGEALLRAVMAQPPGSQLMVEVPAFMAAEPADIRRAAAAACRRHPAGSSRAARWPAGAPRCWPACAMPSSRLARTAAAVARPAAGARQRARRCSRACARRPRWWPPSTAVPSACWAGPSTTRCRRPPAAASRPATCRPCSS